MAIASSRNRGTTKTAIVPKQISASIYSDQKSLPPEFTTPLGQIEKLVGAPLWLLIQNEPPAEEFASITPFVYKGFQTKLMSMNGDSIALLIDSPGGDPGFALRWTPMAGQFLALDKVLSCRASGP